MFESPPQFIICKHNHPWETTGSRNEYNIELGNSDRTPPIIPGRRFLQQQVHKFKLSIAIDKTVLGNLERIGYSRRSEPPTARIRFLLPCHRVVGADRALTGFAGGP
jgi:hypothetical protein